MEGKKIKVIPFDGKRENWHMWSRKFLCKLTVYGYRDILVEKQDIKEEEKTEREEANSMAYSDLLLSMEDEVCFSIVDMANSDEFPMGCTRSAFLRLKEKYESTTQHARCEVKLEYGYMKMKL